ncbi:MAG: hypothetical protein AMXMBFR64_28970 [Myxococcales bacterium]
MLRFAPALLLSLLLAWPASARPKSGKTFTYIGQLQDEAHNPIGGVYPLQFALYASPSSSKALWTETAWVAVDKGRYVIDLGSSSPLPAKLRVEDLTIGVGLRGGLELVREPVAAAMGLPVEPVAVPAPEGRQTVPEPSPRAKNVVEYADKAGYAFEAEHAATADKIENMTLEELKRALATKPSLGKAKKYTGQAGGEGGFEYTEMCPEGYVVVGMTGAAGKFLDSLRLVCAPLE